MTKLIDLDAMLLVVCCQIHKVIFEQITYECYLLVRHLQTIKHRSLQFYEQRHNRGIGE